MTTNQAKFHRTGMFIVQSLMRSILFAVLPLASVNLPARPVPHHFNGIVMSAILRVIIGHEVADQNQPPRGV